MKWIKYNVHQNTINTGTQESPVYEDILLEKKICYSEENLVIAQEEAYNGVYTIEEDDTVIEEKPLAVELGGTGANSIEDARKTLEVSQAIEISQYPGCFYRKVNGNVEWINPPMIPGIEYRTAERFDGRPVFVEVITLPNVAAGGTGSANGVAENILVSFGISGYYTTSVNGYEYVSALNDGEVEVSRKIGSNDQWSVDSLGTYPCTGGALIHKYTKTTY